MCPAFVEELETRGFVALPGFMQPSMLDALRQRTAELFASEGENAGSEFRSEPNARRLANLVAKGEVYEELVSNPDLLDGIRAVLGPRFKLSSLNARCANPFSHSRQPLHIDMGLLPDDRGNLVCNSVWMLDHFTPDNGALRVVPGSHRWGRKPQDVLPDPESVHPDEVLVTGEAGDVVIMNAHLWHGGTENRTARPRCALHAFYCRYDVPQQQYQKRLIPPDVQARFSPELRQVLALDDPLNDELSSPMQKASGFLK